MDQKTRKTASDQHSFPEDFIMDQKTRKTVAAALRSAAAKLQAAGPSPKAKASVSAARKVKAADDEFPALDPKKAMVYFDLHFEDYNLEEDQGPNADEDAQERAAEFLASGKGDLTDAARAAEDAAMKEIGAMLKKAGLNVRLGNEGHGSGDELVMKFGVDSADDIKKLVKFVKGKSGGGDDVIYLDAPYMEARAFVLFPGGVNDLRFGFGSGSNAEGDIEEWLEAQGDAVKGSTKVRASWATAEEFIDFLEGTLIPDLKESGSEFMAEDFEKLVGMLRSGKKDAQFINFLKKTLIPDLKKSGMVETAKDFVSGLKFLKAAADQPTKLKGNAMQKATKKVKAAKDDEARKAALAASLGVEPDEIEESSNYSYDGTFSVGNKEYMVLTEDEADEKAAESIKDSVWAFNADFIIEHSDLPAEAEEMVRFFQEKKSEGANETLTALIKDMDEFIADAISADGRAHFMNSYDSKEEEEGDFLIYRIN